MNKSRVVAALTGSIATGKTVVLDYFRDNLGFKVVSADSVGHEILKNAEIIEKIGRTFGADVIKNGEIDRKVLGKIVFSDKAQLLKLNEITHPAILQKTFEIIDEISKNSPVILEAAILIEAGWHKYFKTVMLTWCKPEIQLDRLMTRDNISEEEAKKRISSQMSFEAKKPFATHLIDTSYGIEVTRFTLERIAKEIL
ncbi:dephospho-CoA kinase [bacterium]|nr:dephospho-CoA kinase [bacterium]MBQ4437462.1 dephospho-CoA kinase [bacterium]